MAHQNHPIHSNYPHLSYVKLWLQKGLKSVTLVLVFNWLFINIPPEKSKILD